MAIQDNQLAVLGAGHLSAALIEGLIASGYAPASITVAAPGSANRQHLAERFKVRTCADNKEAVKNAEIILLAVRPAQVGAALSPLADCFGNRLLISAAAGISCVSLSKRLPAATIVRAMPNLGMAQRCGFTGLAGFRSSQAEALFQRVGATAWVDEELMAAMTALAGSGPGFLFHFAQSLIDGGGELGLDTEQCRQIVRSVVQTCAGLLSRENDAAAWQQKVASKGGTTAAGVESLQQGDLAGLTAAALQAARDRALSLSGALSLSREE